MATPVPDASVSEHRPGRLVGVDVARCLALLGMIAVHVVDSDDAGTGVLLAGIERLGSGRASALFAVLAGVSLALVTGRGTPMTGAARGLDAVSIAARALAVGLVGLVLGELETGIAIILTYYAVLFLLGLPFLGLRARPLLLLAMGWAVAAPVVSHLLRPVLPDRQFASPAFDQLGDPARLVTELLLTGYYPGVVWLAYLLLGIGLGRLDLGSSTTQRRVAALGLAVAVGATAVSRSLAVAAGVTTEQLGAAGGGFGQTPTDRWDWLLLASPHTSTPFDVLHTGGSAAFVLGACLLLVGWVRRLSAAGERTVAIVFGAGTMTLSLYALHVVMRTDAIWPPEEGGVLLWHVLVVLWVGGLYAALGRRGPLERVVGLLPDRIRVTPGRARGRRPRSAPGRAG